MAFAPAWTESTFRFGNDDGSKSAYTFKAAADTNVSLSGGAFCFLQILVQNVGNASGAILFKLQVSKNAGAYADVTTVSSSVKVVDSTNLTNGDDTAQRVGA